MQSAFFCCCCLFVTEPGWIAALVIFVKLIQVLGNESLPQVKEFKYVGVLFKSEGPMELEFGWRVEAAGVVLHLGYDEERA